MTHVINRWRLIAPFFMLCWLFAAFSVNAALPPPSNDAPFWWYNSQVGKDYPTAGMACGDATYPGWVRNGQTTSFGWNEYGCQFTNPDDPNQRPLELRTVSASCRYLGSKWTLNTNNGRCYTPLAVDGACRENELNQSGVCQCLVGFKEEAGVCVSNVVNKCPSVGSAAGVWTVVSSGLGQKKVCNTIDQGQGNCMVTGDSNFCGTGLDGQIHCSFNATYTGKTCTPDDKASSDAGTNGDGNTPQTPAPGGSNDKAMVGKCPGTVNGVNVYVTCSSTTSSTVSSETDSKTGDKTDVQEKIVCDLDKCTKTVTTTISNSSNQTISGSSVVSSGTKDVICANSKAPGCTGNVPNGGNGGGNGDGDGSSFGGSCRGGFVCDGDAATCAIAKAVNESKCRLFDLTDASDEANLNLGKNLANGTDTSVKDPKTEAGGARTFSMTMLQDTPNPYGDACPANVTFMVAGRSVVIPLADNCNILRTLGYAFWASTIFATTIFVLKGQA